MPYSRENKIMCIRPQDELNNPLFDIMSYDKYDNTPIVNSFPWYADEEYY